jgi:hypothetical protein
MKTIFPNKPYIAITKDIINISSNNQFIDTLIYSYIKCRENFETNISDVTEKEISVKLNLTLINVCRSICRLKKVKGLFKKIDTYYKNGKTYNRYFFNKTYSNYFFISYSFITENLDNSIKGFLLQLKAISLNNTNYLLYKSKSNLAKLLHIDIKTLNKYMDIAQIRVINNKELYIFDRHILPTYKKDVITTTYLLLYYWCIDNNIIPPFKTNKYLSVIATKCNIDNNAIKDISYNGMEYLPNLLNAKCGKGIKYLSYEYILKVMNKEVITKNEKNICLM